MVSIHFLNYNFVRKHQSLKTAPSVAAGVISQPMTITELVGLFDEYRSEMYPVERPMSYRPRSNRETYAPEAVLCLGILTLKVVDARQPRRIGNPESNTRPENPFYETCAR